MSKPNCYNCKYRGTIPGDAHSCCHHPETDDTGKDIFAFLTAGTKISQAAKKLEISAHEHGIRRGWFMWPCNFDPAWLITCNGFEEKSQ